MTQGSANGCAFSTSRLVVGDWHDLSERWGFDLVEVVAGVLTPATTVALPPDWSGEFDGARARRWIAARDAESPTLLVIERDAGVAIGLLILFEAVRPGHHRQVDVRVGYVLAEAAWGRGFATELVRGFVTWARSQPVVGSISGGVARDNDASARVLIKNGFTPVGTVEGEHLYRLTLDA